LTEFGTVYIQNNEQVLAAFWFEVCMKDEFESVWKERFLV
jgi:hypothetical protein